MAIKINSTTVIDDTRQFIPATISAGSTTGKTGQILQTTGVGVSWVYATFTGTFDVGITSSVYVSVTSGIGTAVGGLSQTIRNNDIFVGPGIAYSFPSTAGAKYVVESIHVSNVYANELFLSGRHDYVSGAGSTAIPIAQRVIVPYQGALELLEQPMVVNPSDILRLQAFAGVGTTSVGIDGGLDAFIVFSQKLDTTYVGTAKTVGITTGLEIYTASTYPTVMQSMRLINYSLTADVDASVAIYRGGTVGTIVATGVRQGYLAYNLTVPKNSTIEICQRQKYLPIGDSIVTFASVPNVLSVCLSGRQIV
jgi:hypothetical protein